MVLVLFLLSGPLVRVLFVDSITQGRPWSVITFSFLVKSKVRNSCICTIISIDLMENQ